MCSLVVSYLNIKYYYISLIFNISLIGRCIFHFEISFKEKEHRPMKYYISIVKSIYMRNINVKKSSCYN